MSSQKTENEQRGLMRMNGKREKSIWHVSMSSDLLLWSNDLCCLLVSISEGKSRGKSNFSPLKTHQTEKGKDSKEQIKYLLFTSWIFWGSLTSNSTGSKTLSNPSDLQAMKIRSQWQDSWDTNRHGSSWEKTSTWLDWEGSKWEWGKRNWLRCAQRRRGKLCRYINTWQAK